VKTAEHEIQKIVLVELIGEPCQSRHPSSYRSIHIFKYIIEPIFNTRCKFMGLPFDGKLNHIQCPGDVKVYLSILMDFTQCRSYKNKKCLVSSSGAIHEKCYSRTSLSARCWDYALREVYAFREVH